MSRRSVVGLLRLGHKCDRYYSESDIPVIVAALKACSVSGELETGRKIHSDSVRSGNFCNTLVSNSIVNMYAKCGSLWDANRAFSALPSPNVVSWNSLALAYALNGHAEMALYVTMRMQLEGWAPNGHTFVVAFKACAGMAENEKQQNVGGSFVSLAALDRGMSLNARCGIPINDIYIGNALIDMYTRCGSTFDARAVFDIMLVQDVVSWTALLMGYVENDEPELVLELLPEMHDLELNSRTYVAVLNACTRLAEKEDKCLEKGMSIHWQARKDGYELDVFVASSLVSFYSKCNRMSQARDVFDRTPRRDVVLWTAIILGYAENGQGELALSCFWSMQREVSPNSRTYVAALMACASMATHELGMAVHLQAFRDGYAFDVFVSNALLDMYAKCGSIMDARAVFDKMVHHDVVSWSTLMLCYAENGEEDLALVLFDHMDGLVPTARTFVSALVACVNLGCLEKGMNIHLRAISMGHASDVYVANTLIDLYTKCGSMENAKQVFDGMVLRDAASWNSLMVGYVDNGEYDVALEIFYSMTCEPTPRSLVAALRACAGLECLERGMALHYQATVLGCDCSDIFVATALVNMYGKCGSVADARAAFDKMEFHNVVSWTALVLAYVENGESETGLAVFSRMSVTPNARTFAASLNACANLTLLQTGKEIHGEICRHGFECHPSVADCLLDFYGKCGYVVGSEHLFDCMFTSNPSALLGVYSCQGNIDGIEQILQGMTDQGLQMNGMAFLSLLTAYSRAGLVEKGKRCFETMIRQGILPTIEHYHCMVDMLGRANRLHESLGVVERMPYEPTVITWTTVLSACTKWGDVECANVAFEALLKLDPEHAATYSLMANLSTKN